jgi:hypothetical protein
MILVLHLHDGFTRRTLANVVDGAFALDDHQIQLRAAVLRASRRNQGRHHPPGQYPRQASHTTSATSYYLRNRWDRPSPFTAAHSASFTKCPLNDDDLAEFVKWQKTFADSPKSWTVEANSIDPATFDLSVKNPNGGEAVAHRSPEEILDEIAALDAESAEVLETI